MFLSRRWNYSSENKGEFQLGYSSKDPISCVEFAPESSEYLLVSSWDGSVSVVHVPTNHVRVRYSHSRAVLDACFRNHEQVFSGSLDSNLYVFDLGSECIRLVGRHDEPIRKVELCQGLNSVLSGSWDKTVKMWDPRTERNVGTFLQPDKVYALGVSGQKFIVGTRGRKICIWDLRSTHYFLQKRESSLKYQTRCIKSFPDKERFVLSSIEGRVAVEYIDPNSEFQRKKYAFKCHRLKEDDIEKVYPVNCISFHEGHKTFATGGGDGYVNMWDSKNKKRLCQFHRYPAGISALAFCKDGSKLAIASSFIYDVPPPPHRLSSQVFIRFVSDLETKPK